MIPMHRWWLHDLLWITWTWLPAIRERSLNLITYWRMAICENHELVPAMKEKIIPQIKESCENIMHQIIS